MAEHPHHQQAMRIACETVKWYGEGDVREQEAAKELNLWRDHPAYVAAMTALCEVTDSFNPYITMERKK